MTLKKLGPCTTVDKGGVGESGASSLVTHFVTAGPPKNIVVRNVESSLCPNTGAIASITVNGALAASGIITNEGSSIDAEASENDIVVVVVHTIPLFNEIACIRLGELNFIVDECGFI